jgi:TPP-dependent pyruvate/acetoin dehydrogenase alpha subunit
MYRQMVRIRTFEDNANQLYLSAKMPGLTHMYSGEEAVAVGICEALKDDDKITSTHRGHGHCVAKGAEFKEMFCELLGKEEGYCRGKGGSMHIADQSHGNLGANAIVGGSMGIATGAALTAKLLGKDDVTVCFFGDGATAQGLMVRGHEHGRAVEPAGHLCLREQRLFRIHQDRRDRGRVHHGPGRGLRHRGAHGRRPGRACRQR